MTKFEDVKTMTTEEYFNGNQFSIDAFNKKYTTNGMTYVEAVYNVCEYIASAEKTKELEVYWRDRWFDEIFNDYWHPAGSIMQGANSPKKISMSNCTHIGMPKDSLEGIFRYAGYRVAKTAAYRQGLGVDFSKLRPVGSKVHNSSNVSQGVLHWMKLIDSLGNYIGQAGRIPAMLFSISCNHPDLLDFIKVKSSHDTIQNANISIQNTDKFYEAVLADEDWVMEFILDEVKIGDKIYLDERWDDIRLADGDDDGKYFIYSKFGREYEVIQKTEKARKILMLIAENMFYHAEPGIQNIDIAKKYSNSDAVGYGIVGTNACCVVGDTIIMTDKGDMKINDIHHHILNGEYISAYSYNTVTKEYEFKPIKKTFQDRNDVTVELEIEDNGRIFKLECSADHPIYTKNRGYVEALDLTEDDDIEIYHIPEKVKY